MNKKLIMTIVSCTLISNAFALDQAVKEETTPPGAEVALTPNQIPPVLTIQQQPTPAAPAQTAPAQPTA